MGSQTIFDPFGSDRVRVPTRIFRPGRSNPLSGHAKLQFPSLLESHLPSEERTELRLLEREVELSRLSRALDALSAGEGCVIVATGPAGIGKTKLLEAATGSAADVGVRPLVARASELESGYAFGVVRQLIEKVVMGADDEERGQLLSGAAERSAAVLDIDPVASADRELHATLHGLYWLLVNLSAGGPLLVAIDDLQWADEPSLRWLAYLTRRLEHLPIAVMVSARTEPGTARVESIRDSSTARHDAIEEVLGSERALRLAPEPLSDEGVAAILERELRSAPDVAFTQACRIQTGGNPFLLSELMAELSAEGVSGSATDVALLERIVPERVGETTRRHLTRLSPTARRLATALSVLGDGVDLAIAAELAGMEAGDATSAVSELVNAQILADSAELRFRHPLLRAAVQSEMTAVESATLHGTAARLLADRGAPDGRIGAHLVASLPGGGDGWTVERLRSAARSARSQGAPEQAADLLRRALDEPPDAATRPDVLEELGLAEHMSLDSAAADRFAEALGLTEDLERASEFALMAGLSHYYAGRHEAAVDILMETAERMRGEPGLRDQWLMIEAFLALAGRYDLGTQGRVEGRIEAIANGLKGNTPAERLVLATFENQHPGPTAADLVRSTALWDEVLSELSSPDPYHGVGAVAMYAHAGRPDLADARAQQLLREAGETGSPMRNSLGLSARGYVALDRGDLRAAEADMEAAVEGGAELEGNIAFLVLALALRGKLEQGEQLLGEREMNGELERRMFNNPLLFGRGHLRFAQRRWEEASADFRELGKRYEEWGVTRPVPPWRSSLALSLLAQGDAKTARELGAEELELTIVWDTPKAIANSRRAIALAEGGEGAIEELSEVVELLEGTPWRFDRARVRCDLGSALRRDGQRRAGREALALAMDEAHACGADPLAELAAEELRASGARPRRRAISGLDALTPSELRVATLAAEERTNRDIAQELFVTLATVETHLTRAYRKLDIAGRSELAGALAGDVPAS